MKLLVSAALWGLVPAAAAVEITPLYKIEVLGGQYFFAGRRGALSGNVYGLAAPALRLSERWVLLPTISSRYQGTRQVVDLVGAGTIFREEMDHRAGLKAVYQPTDSKWRFKPALSYRMRLLKETADEKWFKGLFDYQALDAGFEAEYVYQAPFSLRAGFDYVRTAFVNYNSLESRAALDFQGRSLARERAGDRIYDSDTLMLSLAGSRSLLGRGTVEASLNVRRQTFPKQHLVEESGLFSSETREDYITGLDVLLRWPVEFPREMRAVFSLGAGYLNMNSNQNSYDAPGGEFLPGYYDYGEARIRPGLRVLLGDERQPIVASFDMSFALRRYPNRRAQNASGTYLAENLRQNSWMLSLSADYPMAPRLSVLFNLQYGRNSSNQGFEQFYSYNYAATNYLIGFRYDY